MSESKLRYCVNCDEMRKFTVRSENVTAEVRGMKYSYVEQAAFCTECGSEVYVPEINDVNVQAAEAAYRKAAN